MKKVSPVIAALLSVCILLVSCTSQEVFGPEDMYENTGGGMYFGMRRSGFSVDFPIGKRIPVDEMIDIVLKARIAPDTSFEYLSFSASEYGFLFSCKDYITGIKKDSFTLSIENFFGAPDQIHHYVIKKNGEVTSEYYQRSFSLSVKYIGTQPASGFFTVHCDSHVSFTDEDGNVNYYNGDGGKIIYYAVNDGYIAFSDIDRKSTRLNSSH